MDISIMRVEIGAWGRDILPVPGMTSDTTTVTLGLMMGLMRGYFPSYKQGEHLHHWVADGRPDVHFYVRNVESAWMSPTLAQAVRAIDEAAEAMATAIENETKPPREGQ